MSADGRTALTGSNDGTAILWDISDPARPARRSTLTGHTETVNTVALSADGRTALINSADGRAILWDLHPLDELLTRRIDRACAAAGGGLTPAEWERYIPTLAYRTTCGP
ncbi:MULTISPECIES: hypothetical protein [unclassified Parafrankia]|uniref:WD40 repeat domain-containing protein n=1 Tax=unclassified Parafrankia TaxID=2994368 RepID=UPI00135703DE|nr:MULTISPECIES: hypothetical protein [unclassified Parafrankia]